MSFSSSASSSGFPRLPAPAALATDQARSRFGITGPLLASWAPGRVNLIGEHTDYNEGYVLPIAIERVVALAGQLLSDPEDRTVRLYSSHHDQSTAFPLDQLPSAVEPGGQPLWALYVAGVLGELQSEGIPLRGFSASIAGDVPTGQGLSSSAALVIATVLWLDEALQLRRTPLELARLGQLAETRGTGVRVGIMDHAASVLGRPDHAVLIDCRSLAYQAIPFDLPSSSLLICDSGVERSLASSAYNERRRECEIAVSVLQSALAAEGIDPPLALRDVTRHQLRRLGGRIPEPARQRAWHVVTENDRTLSAVEALREQNATRFGELILASHSSLRDNYAVSCGELDALVEIATQAPGAYGARVVGAGFGGGVLIVAPLELQEQISERIYSSYPARSGREPEILPIRPAGGPGHATVGEL
ncbi:MAG: galactokinase [Ktedonobacterales bacterium]